MTDSQRHALPTDTHAAWNEGAKAAQAGKPFAANPYSPLNYRFVVWGNGWLVTTHTQARNDDEEL